MDQFRVFKFKSNFTGGDLAVPCAAMLDAIEQTLSIHQLRNSDFQLALFEHYTMTNVAMLFGNNNAEATVDNIFGDEKLRDFVLDLSIRFYARYTDEHASYRAMVKAISRALSPFCIVSEDGSRHLESSVPEVIKEVIMSPIKIERFLLAHRWLIPYYLSLLYVQIETI